MLALLILSAFALAAPARAFQAEKWLIENVKHEPLPIAVPSFEVEGDQQFQDVDLAQIITNDLRLSGFFKPPENTQFIADVQALDLKEGNVHHPDWQRIGVSYVVKGKYRISGDKVEAEVLTFDTITGSYIFGKRYPAYDLSDPRYLAHRISDEIVLRVTGFDGIANSKLLFVREVRRRPERVTEVFVMDSDGAGVVQKTTDGAILATPTWGANATEFYYTTWRDYNPDLAGAFADGSYKWWVSRQWGFNLSPAWSPKRKLIALTLSRDGNSEIYLIDREGKGPGGRGPKRLSYNRAIEAAPCWSPSGDQIAFTSDRNGRPQIFVMDDTGVNVRQLTTHGDYSDGAAWSPQGDSIAFASRVDGVFQIFTCGPDGKNLRQLTTGSANNEDPTWAPNGWVIAYTSERGGSRQIHSMFVDGRHIAQLTSGEPCNSADWSVALP